MKGIDEIPETMRGPLYVKDKWVVSPYNYSDIGGTLMTNEDRKKGLKKER